MATEKRPTANEGKAADGVRRVSRIVGGGYDEFWRCNMRYRVV